VKFNSGIVQVTLFKNDAPVAERLTFVDRKDALEITVKDLKPVYGANSQMDLSFDVREGDKPVMGSYSLSIIDVERLGSAASDEGHILSNLLLTSDLRGVIEHPEYYFDKTQANAEKHLNLLLMTQGWRRFKWKEVIEGTYTKPVFNPEVGLSVSGIITSHNDKPYANAKALIMTTLGGVTTADTLTDNNGAFIFDRMSFPDKTAFVIRASKESGGRSVKTTFNIEPPVTHRTAPLVVAPFDLLKVSENGKKQYQAAFMHHQEGLRIREVEIKAEQKRHVRNSTNLNGPGVADQVIKGEQLESSISIIDYLSKYVNGVIMERGLLSFTRNGVDINGRRPSIMFVWNGIPVDQDYIENISVNEVDAVEVLKSTSFNSVYGMEGMGGVVIITTKMGMDLQKPYNALGVSVIRPKGFTIQREFYQPKFSIIFQ
ncbi:MAG: hypothetical protein EOO00_09930, partial [Chitinophagaceae bacterium]